MTTWEPIVDGALAESAMAAVDDIGHALPQPGEVWGVTADATLASGEAGLALFWAYRHRSSGTSWHVERSIAHLDQAIDAVADSVLPESLYSGFSGIAWVADHLEGRELHESSDMNASIDEALIADLKGRRLRPFDLVVGLAGLGVYAVDRSRHAAGRRCLSAVLAHLEATAERQPDRATWFTPPALSSPHQRTYGRQGHYNLGLAHGVPGVIGLLGTVIAEGVEDPGTRSLLDDAVAWLMSCRLPDDRPTVIPNYVAGGSPGTDGRSGWCYGDPGVAAAILIAARATRNEAWEIMATRWLHKCAVRPMPDTGVRDAGLCHGAAGLAHIFNRAYQATRIDAFKQAARRWLHHLFRIRRDGEAFAGFPASAYTKAHGERWEPRPGLLTGATGVGLALLASVTAVEPAWDRCMMLDIPPRA